MTDPALLTDPVLEHARAVIERGSLSYTLAARALDPVTRAGGYQLYAWCRHCDDVIDGQSFGHDMQVPSVEEQRRLLTELKITTERALRGEPVDRLVFRGIARVVRQHDIPERHLWEFLAGMEADVQGRRYRTLEEVTGYCYQVAGVVGVMMGHIMGIKDPVTLRRAQDLGVAMQYTNISRDVMDDAPVGRVYFPLDWLDAAGLPPDQLADPARREDVVRLVVRLLDLAEPLYRNADTGLQALPFGHAWSILAARQIYADLSAVIRRRGTHAWDTRSAVSAPRKLWLMARALTKVIAR